MAPTLLLATIADDVTLHSSHIVLRSVCFITHFIYYTADELSIFLSTVNIVMGGCFGGTTKKRQTVSKQNSYAVNYTRIHVDELIDQWSAG